MKDPVAFSQAMERNNSSKWVDTMNDELKSMTIMMFMILSNYPITVMTYIVILNWLQYHCNLVGHIGLFSSFFKSESNEYKIFSQLILFYFYFQNRLSRPSGENITLTFNLCSTSLVKLDSIKPTKEFQFWRR